MSNLSVKYQSCTQKQTVISKHNVIRREYIPTCTLYFSRKVKDEPDDSDYYKSSSSKHKKSKRSKRDKDDDRDASGTQSDG